jgi:hypothetical protein
MGALGGANSIGGVFRLFFVCCCIRCSFGHVCLIKRDKFWPHTEKQVERSGTKMILQKGALDRLPSSSEWLFKTDLCLCTARKERLMIMASIMSPVQKK